MRIKTATAIIALSASMPLFSQVMPSATDRKLPEMSIGGGISRINPDDGHGTIYGGVLWVNQSLNGLPSTLHGLGVTMEAQDLHMNRSATTAVLREDVALGGVTWSAARFRTLHPYAKFLSGLGNVDYQVSPTRTYNQSRTVLAFGGGLEQQASRRLSMRLDYEYQFMGDFFLGTPRRPTSGSINPQGFTVGALYRLGHNRAQQVQ